MRMLKKLLLTGAFIGVLGSFGFAQEAKAAASVSVNVAGDKATFNVTSVSGNKLDVQIGGQSVGTKDITPGSTQSIEIASIKNTVNDNLSKYTTSPLTSIKAVLLSGNSIITEEAVGEGTIANGGLYRVEVSAETGGTVTVEGVKGNFLRYDYSSASYSLKATANANYSFVKWSDGNTNAERTVSPSASTNGLKAEFKSTLKPAPAKATVNGTTTYNSVTRPNVSMSVGDTIKISTDSISGATGYEPNYDVYWDDYFTQVSTYTWKAKAVTDSDFPLEVSMITYYGTESVESDPLYITISKGSGTASKVTLSDFKDYITEGYTLEFKGKAANETTDLTLVISDGKDYVDSVDRTQNTSDKNVTFKIKFKDEKQDKGTNSKDVKFKIMVGGESGTACTIDSDTETEKKVTVYSNPTNSYNNSDRTMSYKVPAKVNTGTESGKDSNLSYTQDTVSDVKGIRINVLLNDNILGTTTTASGKGTGATVDASTMESIITNLGNSGKFTGDCTVVFRAYPSDGSGNCNKKVYHDTYAKVYKVVLKPGQSATAGAKTASAYALPIAMIAQRNTGATTTTATTTTAAGKEYVLYGLEGQTLTAPAGVTDLVDANGNAVTKIVVSADANKNVYTYAATASAATKEGLDKVPKTGQNNVFVYVMAVVVCGAVGYGLYVYNKKSKKSI